MAKELVGKSNQDLCWINKLSHGDVNKRDVKLRGTCELMDHQKVGIGFMYDILSRGATINGEKVYGCILGDEAGLGKTLTSLATCKLLLDNEKIGSILCIVPKLSVWQGECKNVFRSKYVGTYHGPGRSDVDYSDYKIVLSTYEILVREYDVEKGKFSSGSIFRNRWGVVMLDECHLIKGDTKRFKACQKLRTSKKVCISATLFMNGMGDVCNILRFLGLVSSIKEYERRFPESLVGLENLRVILCPLWIRRLKSDLELPEKRKYLVHLGMQDEESAFYKALHTYSKKRLGKLERKYNKYKEQRLDDHRRSAMGNALTMILRMRQACVNAWMVFKKMDRLMGCSSIGEGTKMLLDCTKDKVSECGMCCDRGDYWKNKRCGHRFCKPCWKKWEEKGCPDCGEDRIKLKYVGPDEVSSRDLRNFTLGMSKYMSLKSRLRKDMKRGEKSIVVSQFLGVLDDVERMCRKDKKLCKYGVCKYVGGQSEGERNEIVEDFQSDDGDSRIMLLSLMAGNNSITLHAARNMYLMDTWWNDGVEYQVENRIHRIGQKNDVNIHKFVMKDSIESRILKLIEQKKLKGEWMTGDEHIGKITEKKGNLINNPDEVFRVIKLLEDDPNVGN